MDAAENAARRLVVISQEEYGPARPREVNASFWRDKAKFWGTDTREAQTMRCGNCASFDLTKAMRDCLLSASSTPEAFDESDVDAGEVGYCRTYEFRATSLRTCDAWSPGGPIRR